MRPAVLEWASLEREDGKGAETGGIGKGVEPVKSGYDSQEKKDRKKESAEAGRWGGEHNEVKLRNLI